MHLHLFFFKSLFFKGSGKKYRKIYRLACNSYNPQLEITQVILDDLKEDNLESLELLMKHNEIFYAFLKDAPQAAKNFYKILVTIPKELGRTALNILSDERIHSILLRNEDKVTYLVEILKIHIEIFVEMMSLENTLMKSLFDNILGNRQDKIAKLCEILMAHHVFVSTLRQDVSWDRKRQAIHKALLRKMLYATHEMTTNYYHVTQAKALFHETHSTY